MDITIRRATKKDLTRIVELSVQLYKTEQPFDKNLKDEYYETKKGTKGLLKDIKDKKRIFLVAIYEENVVGYIDGYIYDKEDVYIEKMAYLDRIIVDKNYKGKGIATKLVDEFSNQLKKENVKFIKLNAFKGNKPAIALYEKMGFYEYSVFYMKKIDE